MNPGLGEAYASRALTYTQLGEDDNSRQDVEKALELGVDTHAAAIKYYDFTTLREAFEDLAGQR